MKRATWWMGWLAAAAMAGSAAADEITLEQAETAVGNWIARGGAFGKLASQAEVAGETFVDSDTGAKMHVVRVPGKGFAVTSADDGIEPIILFSDGDGEFVAEEGNPLWNLLRWDLEARAKALEAGVARHSSAKDGALRGSATNDAKTPQGKWAELLEEETSLSHGSTPKVTVNTKKTISDIRRDEILKTTWGQTVVSGQNACYYAYNYYTPGKLEVIPVSTYTSRKSSLIPDSTAYETNEVGHYPCGCVATAGGQLMRKWKYPSAPKTKKTVTCTRDGSPLSLTMKGGIYDWSRTGMGEATPATEPQCEAVGRILFDIGVSCGADYTADGTSMSAADLANNLRTVFGYKSSTWFGTAFYEFESTVLERLKKIAIPNLDAGAPILLSIKRSRFNEAINHCVVADGYGYDNGEFSIHINFGWNGTGNGWYVPPSFHPDPNYDYDFIRGVVGNVFPNGTGSVASGRAEGAHGRPVSGVQVQLCTTSGNVLQTKTTGSDGVYWFMQDPGSYMIKAEVESAMASGTLVLSQCGDDSIGNVVQDWSLTSVPTVASISAVAEKGKGVRDVADATFSTPFEVRLSSGTAGAEIRYTLDGTQPTPESAAYEGPIDIQDTTTLRAVAYADGMECSEEFSKTWTFNDPTSRDNFADARPISGASGKSSFNNAGYTKESGEPTHSSKGTVGGASAWAVWTAPETGDWTFRLSGVFRDYPDENMDTQLAVYTGDVVSNLTRVAANDDANRNEEDYSSRVSFAVEKGKTYHIAMDSYRGDQYPGTLKLEWEEGYVHYVQVAYTPQWVPVSGGQQEMEVDASANWHVMDCSDWIAPVNNSGKPGDVLAYVVATNMTGNERAGFITLQAGNSELVSLTIRQHRLDFVTTKESALDRAWRENKRILIIYGREGCAYTSATMFSTLPTASVRTLLEAGFVLWYSNCDRQSDASPFVRGFGGSTLPTLAIVDPLDLTAGVAGLGGYQSASAIQRLLQTAPSWQGLPPVQIALGTVGSTSATATTKVRAWGAGANSAAVTLETARDAAFSSGKTTRKMGTVTEIWTEQEWTFGPPSATEAAFCRLRVTSGDWSKVSDVVEFIPLGIALDNTNLTFASEGEVPWLGQTAVSHDGVDAARCAIDVAAGTNRWVESRLKTTIQGPGRLSFCWKGDGAYGWLNLWVDGQEEKTISVTNRIWRKVSWDFPNPSEHEVEWVLQRYNSPSEYYNATGWVDQVTWTPEEMVPLANALDNDALAFTSEGDVLWLGQTAVSHDGVDAARCANPATNEQTTAYSWLKTEVKGPGRLSFWWKADGNYGTLSFLSDGDMHKSVSSSDRVWTEGSWDFADTNRHEAAWRLSRYNSSYYGMTGWVDQVTWTPGNIVTLDRQDGYASQTVLGIRGEAMPAVVIPTRTGYTFGGYYSGTNGTGTRYYTATGTSARTWNRSGNATLYAQWTPKTYTATLDREGGTGGTASVKATYGEYPPAVDIPTQTGFDFTGYYSGKNGTGVQYYNAAGVSIRTWNAASNATLHAHWMEKAEVKWGYRIENGKAIVTNAAPARGKLSMPASLGGCPVEAIEASAFSGETNLLEMVVSSKVKDIGEYAFRDCGGLASVTLPPSVTNIDNNAFLYCRGLTSVAVPAKVKRIGHFAFYGCNGLSSLTLGNGVKDICKYAFDGCSRLTSVTIPAQTTNIGFGAFAYCSSLTQLQVADGNARFASENGVLFSKDKATLVCCPGGKAGAYELPASVTAIGTGAFYSCSQLTSVAIPNGVLTIGEQAFYSCSQLASAVIPDSVTNLGRSAFAYCRALARLEVPGAWWGTDKVAQAGVPDGCEVVYRGIRPLAVTTAALPAGLEGVAYEASLSATGGIAPYTWSEGGLVYTEKATAGSHAATGTARGWQTDDGCWDFALPFAFPFYGHSYTNAKINSNGAISFGNGSFTSYSYSVDTFKASPIVAVLWKDLKTTGGDIYTETGSDWAKVRWKGTYYSGGEVNFSATLRKNGTIELSYGAGNSAGGVIGISAGDGATWMLSEKSGTGSMANAGNIVFRPGTGIPEWLALTAGGVLRGTPAAAGEYAFAVAAADAAGVVASQNLVLAVRPLVSQRVTFDANGGTCGTATKDYDVGGRYGSLPTATRNNYSFIGWFTKKTGGAQVTTNTTVAKVAELKLWAHWAAPNLAACKPAGWPAEIYLATEKGGTTATTNVWTGETVYLNCAYTNAGNAAAGVHSVAGVVKDSRGVAVTNWSWSLSKLGTNAACRRMTNIALSVAAAGTHSVVITLDSGGAVAESDESDNEMRLSFTASDKQTVTFNANGGTCAATNRFYAVGKTYGELPEATKKGYSCLGWFTSATGGVQVTAASPVTQEKARTLWARWKANAYAVALDAQGGSGGTTNVTATYGKAMPAITVPTRAGYTFGGYYSSTNGSGTRYYTETGASARTWNQTAATTLHAKWTANVYSVVLDPQAGTGGTASVLATYGAAMPAIEIPAKKGYSFGGYYKKKNGGGTQYYTAEGTSARGWNVASNTTLYAKWTVADVPKTVWRFYSKSYKGHFFTISEEEKNGLIAGNPNWAFEGGAYRAYTNAAAGTVALHRFYSKGYRGHFFTIDEAEKDGLAAGNPNWTYEGVAYYVYPQEAEGTVPVHRFWSKGYRHHFYTIDEEEKDTLIATNPNWAYEGVAFWALALEGTGAGARGRAVKSEQRKVKSETAVEETRGHRDAGSTGVEGVAGVTVTTSDGTDGSAVCDGDEETGWTPEGAGPAWVVLSFAEAREAAGAEVIGENLPEGMRVLWSEDAETWEEVVAMKARYVWVAWEAAKGIVVKEIRVKKEE